MIDERRRGYLGEMVSRWRDTRRTIERGPDRALDPDTVAVAAALLVLADVVDDLLGVEEERR